jgi:hypothetical protein
LRINQIIEDGDIGYIITIPRGYLKGGRKLKSKVESRSIKIYDQARDICSLYMDHYNLWEEDPKEFLFRGLQAFTKEGTYIWRPIRVDEKGKQLALCPRACQLFYREIFKDAKMQDNLIRYFCQKYYDNNKKENNGRNEK